MWPFKCTHPFEYLLVEKEQTVTTIDADFERVEYHFICGRCGEKLKHTHAKLVGGMESFMLRLKENLK